MGTKASAYELLAASTLQFTSPPLPVTLPQNVHQLPPVAPVMMIIAEFELETSWAPNVSLQTIVMTAGAPLSKVD
ncbi:hypothetical protein TYRP_020104 [Tyrophagus putrescentiae]|nr:hypothetical protein TYRP_020104 [Tyrophagus putrescentiae]